MGTILENLVDCRLCNCNFLLNIGPMGNGSVRPMDAAFLSEIGKFIKVNKGFIYSTYRAEISADGAGILTDGKYYYAIVKNVRMSSSPNVVMDGVDTKVTVLTDKKIKNARWLDSGRAQSVKKNSFTARPYLYGESYGIRVLRFELE
jgi:alpha-L-fucosidase